MRRLVVLFCLFRFCPIPFYAPYIFIAIGQLQKEFIRNAEYQQVSDDSGRDFIQNVSGYFGQHISYRDGQRKRLGKKSGDDTADAGAVAAQHSYSDSRAGNAAEQAYYGARNA